VQQAPTISILRRMPPENTLIGLLMSSVMPRTSGELAHRLPVGRSA
jgi:hypothetical protein